MKKIIRLTESDLMRLVKRVINEQEEHGMGALFPEPKRDYKEYPKNYVFDLLNDKKNYIGEFMIVEIRGSETKGDVITHIKGLNNLDWLILKIKFSCLNKNGGFKVVDIEQSNIIGGKNGTPTPIKLVPNSTVYSPLLEDKLKKDFCMKHKPEYSVN